MAWADVEIDTLTTIEAADLNQMRANAQHVRDDLVGRVLAVAPIEFVTAHLFPQNTMSRVRLRFGLGALAWLTDWAAGAEYAPLPGITTNLDAGGVADGGTELVVTAHLGFPGNAYEESELFRLATFISSDIASVSFFGELKVGPTEAFARSITLVGSYVGGL